MGARPLEDPAMALCRGCAERHPATKLATNGTCSNKCYKRVARALASATRPPVFCCQCGGEFRPAAPNQRGCSERCRTLLNNDRWRVRRIELAAEREAARKATEAAALAALMAENNQIVKGRKQLAKNQVSIPCFACKHWEALEGSSFGGQCVIARWRVCKPLTEGATPYEMRDDA